MDGVLEGAVVLCACKLACSLLFLPSLAASYSPVSFCSCCLLIFTDFLVTVYLSTSWVFESWLSVPPPLSDVVALRFLLFLGHTYRAVLLLTTPLIAAETLVRLLWPHSVAALGTRSKTAGCDGQRCQVGEEEAEEAEESDGDRRLSHAVGYLCCLSVWVIVALNVRWKWKLEEVWTVACLQTTSSLVSCLPKLLSSMPGVGSPCWGLAFLLLLLLLLLLFFLLFVITILQRQQTPTERESRDAERRWPALAPPSAAPFQPASPGTPEPARRVDPEKTESSCSVHRACSWNSVQMSARRHGDLILISPACLSVKRGQQEHERTMRGLPPTRITREHVNSPHSSRRRWRLRGFPCSGVNVMTGLVGVLSILVLPLYLSVNILLFRAVETLLELSIKSFISPSAHARRAPPPPPRRETLV